jgi:hypothetical protein
MTAPLLFTALSGSAMLYAYTQFVAKDEKKEVSSSDEQYKDNVKTRDKTIGDNRRPMKPNDVMEMRQSFKGRSKTKDVKREFSKEYDGLKLRPQDKSKKAVQSFKKPFKPSGIMEAKKPSGSNIFSRGRENMPEKSKPDFQFKKKMKI